MEIVFLESLKEHIQDYIDIAKMTNKERAKEEEFSQASSDKVQQNVQGFTNALSNSNQGTTEATTNTTDDDTSSQQTEISQFEEYLQDTNSTEEKIVGSKRKYPIQINDVVKKDFIVEWSIGNKAYWINAEESEDGSEINIVININHPFFKPYSNN